MNGNQMPLEDFVSLPDTIPLILRDGSLGSEQFRQSHNIHKGTVLNGGYSIDYVTLDKVDSIEREIGTDKLNMFPIVLGLLDQQSLTAAGIIQVQRQPYLDLRGQGVLIGFIDTGIDYTNNIFQYENGTSKIQYIWDQTLKGKAPDGFYFGAEYTAKEINSALQSENPRGKVPHQDRAGHGTFLASIAAGRESGQHIGAAPDAEIIAVKLRKAQPFFYEQYLIPEWQENTYTSSDLMLGVQYIVNKADEMHRPVVICIALGSHLGSRDGLSIIEKYLTSVSNITWVAIVCAAGNEGHTGRHASGRLVGKEEPQNVELTVGGHADSLYMSLWNGAADRMAVSLTSPTGEIIPKIPVRQGTAYNATLVLEKTRITVEYYLPVGNSGDQLTIIKIMQPTPGIWTLTVHGEIVLDGTYHLWLPLTGFVDPSIAFLMPSPNVTIVTPATADGVISCGAYDSRNNALFTNTSFGPTRASRTAPDFVAPGVNVGGVFPTGYGQMSGTSVSAAIAAGGCALMMQWGVVEENDMTLTTGRIKANLIRGCNRQISMQYPNPQWGYGTLDLFNALNMMRYR